MVSLVYSHANPWVRLNRERANPNAGRWCHSLGARRPVSYFFTRVTLAMYSVVLPIRRLYEHHMVSTDVCDASDLLTSGRRHTYGHGTDKTSRKPPTPPRTVCNGFTVTQAMHIVVPSIGRLYEHHMVPENVCDA